MGTNQFLRDARDFEEKTRQILSEKWNVPIKKLEVAIGNEYKKKFDCVSQDRKYVGDAKYLKNIENPAAKWAGIAEFVWLLEQVKAEHKFLVFGNGREVPVRWLKRHKSLLKNVTFYFLNGQEIENLN